MLGVVLLGDRKLRVKEFPDPEPGYGQSVVRIKAAAICGSDMFKYRTPQERLKGRPELIQGHEPSGVIENVGEGVDFLKKGDRVSVYHATGCGHCSACLSGYMMYCRNSWLLGSTINGSDADFLLVPAIGCLKLPDELSFIDGAIMMCAGGTSFQALVDLDVSGIDTVALFGLGPLGLCGVMIGKALGAKVVGVDLVDEKLELANKLGADEVIDARKEDPVETIMKLTGRRGVDKSVDFSGNPIAQRNVLACTRVHGRAAFIGVNPGELTIRPGIVTGKTLISNWIFPISSYETMVDFMLKHDLSFERTVTHRFNLDQADEAFTLFDTMKTGKVVFTM